MSHIQSLIDAINAYKNAKEHLVEVEADYKLERVSEGEFNRMKTMCNDRWDDVLTILKRV